MKKNVERVFKNSFYLFILQGANYILPLLVIPYLVRVLGMETFGLLAFVTASINIFRSFVSYGFDLTGTQLISRNRLNIKKVTIFFNSIVIVKILLAFLSFIFILGIIFVFDKFFNNWDLIFISSFLMFSDALFPIWFFQGIEKMQVITYLRILHKTVYVLMIFIFVDTKENVLLVPLFDFMGALFITFFAYSFIRKTFKIKFFFPKYKYLLLQIKMGWHVFLSKVSVIFYTSFNTFILGILTTNEIVGYYSLAEKIYMAIRNLFTPIIQALFPFLSRKYFMDKTRYFYIVNKISYIYTVALLFLSILGYNFSSEIVFVISGKNIAEANEILQLLSIALAFSVGSFYSILLIIKNEGKALARITFSIMIINIVFIYPVIYSYGVYGLAYLFIFLQFVQSTLQIYYNKEVFFIKRGREV